MQFLGVNIEKGRWKFGLKEMSALFLQGWPGTTKLLAVFTRVVSVFASRDLLCRSPIIDPLRKARADPLRCRRGYRLAPRYKYHGQSICFNSFSMSCVILYYQRICLHEWYTKNEWFFCFIINPYPTAFPYGNGMVLHFYQQQESSTTKTVHKVINKGLKTYV